MGDKNTLPYALNTYSYTQSHTAENCLRHLSAQGVCEFELMMYPGHIWPLEMSSAERVAFREFYTEQGLTIVIANMPNIDLNLAAAAEGMREYSREILKSIIVLAADLAIPSLIIGPGKPNPLMPMPKKQMLDYFFMALDELVPFSRSHGLQILVENMPFAFLPDANSLMDALDEYGTEDIGVVYDVANGFFINEDIATGMQRCLSRLERVHLSDTGRKTYKHDPVGKGDINFLEVGQMLYKIGHTRRPILEIISFDPDTEIFDSIAQLDALGWRDLANN